MQSTEQYILEFVVLTFLLVVLMVIILIRLANKQRSAEGKSDDEHYGIFQYLKLIGGRLQFLQARSIAEELEQQIAESKKVHPEDAEP